MPRLSDSMEEGTILRWLVESGATVARGDEIVEIETDKANMTYEADAGGVLEIVASEGDTLPIGELIARIGGGSGAAGDSSEGQAELRAGPDDSGRAHAGPSAGARASSSPPARSAEAADAEGSAAPSPSMPVVDERSDAPAENGRVKASPV